APAGDTLPFRVIDGGVLDNIPVAAAIRAIAAKPANGPTERWLLYLHPSPAVAGPDATTTGPSRPAPPRPIGAVGATIDALSARASQESLLGDIDELDAHNDEVARVAMRRRALLAPLAAVPPEQRTISLTVLTDEVWHDHARLRADLHADDVSRLLQDP